MISVNDVSKYYGDFLAVDRVSFSIREGEITGLLGPNGAGKTTTLRMLTGYLAADGGTISVGEHRIDENPLDVKRMIGYLPESAPIYGDMVVYDYLRYVAAVRGIDDLARLRETAAMCGITEVMHRNISELSKGYKQRVGLAHAMIHDPAILILDEPTSGLDPNQIIEIRNLIREIGRKKTVILSTHILPEVEATCDRVIIINRGKIVADDRTENLQAGVARTVSLTVDGVDRVALADVLSAMDGVRDVRHLPEGEYVSVLVTTSQDRDLRPDIFRAAVQRNWTLYELKNEYMSLENVFRELTGGNNGDQN